MAGSRCQSHHTAACVVADYCSTLYADEDGAEIERCWLAYNWLDERLAQTDAACEIEVRDGVVNGIDCQRLDKFQVCSMGIHGYMGDHLYACLDGLTSRQL